MTELHNQLLKIRVDHSGSDQWYMKPELTKKGPSQSYGHYMFRGDDEAFRKLLIKMKVCDTNSKPASYRDMKYKDIVQDMKKPTRTYVWAYSNKWKAANVIMTEVSKDESMKYIKKMNEDYTVEFDGDSGEWRVIVKGSGAIQDSFTTESEAYMVANIMNSKSNVVEATEEFQVPGTNYIIEKGDHIQILKEDYQEVAEIIRQQIGRQALYMMGTKQLSSSDEGQGGLGIRFTASKIANYVKIVLNDKDLYDVTFSKIRGMDFKEVKVYNDVYVDMLSDIISDTTGLALSL